MKRLSQVIIRATILGILLPVGVANMPAQSTHAGGHGSAGLYPLSPTPAGVGEAPVADDNARAGSGTGLKISTFYPVSQVDNNNWVKLDYPTPKKTTSFAASQTWWVPFYFVYSGAVAKVTKFSGDVRSASGTVVAKEGLHTLNFTYGTEESSISWPNKSGYPNGAYTVELTSGGKVVATTTFTVGDQNRIAGGLKISTFYPVSQTDATNWVTLNYPTPKKTTSFAGGATWWIGFFFTYSGAVAKVTKFSGDIRNAEGTVMAASGPYTLNAKSNKQEFSIPRANKVAYPDGAYTAELTSGGSVVATTTFHAVGS